MPYYFANSTLANMKKPSPKHTTPFDFHFNCSTSTYTTIYSFANARTDFQVPQNFRFVIEQTLREFFRSIQTGKDTEQSWKKSIYKVISRMDDPVPEYFKSPNFLEQLE